LYRFVISQYILHVLPIYDFYYDKRSHERVKQIETAKVKRKIREIEGGQGKKGNEGRRKQDGEMR
jgi:hypothetical protein